MNREAVARLIARRLEALPRGTASRVAESMGYGSSAAVSAWRNGKSLPDVARWPEVEELLGMRPGTLRRAAGLVDEHQPPSDAEMVLLRSQVADLTQRVQRLEAAAGA